MMLLAVSSLVFSATRLPVGLTFEHRHLCRLPRRVPDRLRQLLSLPFSSYMPDSLTPLSRRYTFIWRSSLIWVFVRLLWQQFTRNRLSLRAFRSSSPFREFCESVMVQLILTKIFLRMCYKLIIYEKLMRCNDS